MPALRPALLARRPHSRALAALCLAVLLALPAAAQGRKKRKVLQLEALKVEGRIQKPQAFYVLQRSTLSFEELSKTESFLPKILHSVESAPF